MALAKKEREDAAGEVEGPPAKKQKSGVAQQAPVDPRLWRWMAAEQEAKEKRARRSTSSGGGGAGTEEGGAAQSDGEEVEVDSEVAVRAEVDRYFRLKISHPGESPIKWWRERRGAFPILSKLAAKYLSIPASSASVERVFSQAGLTLTKLRNRMGADTLEELLMIEYHHASHGWKYYTPKQWAELTQGIFEEVELEDEAEVVTVD